MYFKKCFLCFLYAVTNCYSFLVLYFFFPVLSLDKECFFQIQVGC